MKKAEEFIQVIEKIRTERDYQDQYCSMRGMAINPTVEGELLMLKAYVDKATVKWTDNADDRDALEQIRKIAGIAIRCLENHGCPKRDLIKSSFENKF